MDWLREWSVDAVRALLGLDGPIVLRGGPHPDPEWSGGGAVIDNRYVAKIALSAVTARRIAHEARMLGALRDLQVPQLVRASTDPTFLVTELVPGRPLERATAAHAPDLAAFLARLHERPAPGRPPTPGVQATTDALRARLAPFIRRDQIALVQRWCDWTDETLAGAREHVLVHGDLHGHNTVWEGTRLQLVADLETSGAAEREYDFRYLPAYGAEFFAAMVAAYGRPLELARVMGWHVRTHLGDALWRSEAGVPLPSGGTPADYVDELAQRFTWMKSLTSERARTFM